MWAHYHRTSPYRRAVQGLSGGYQPIGADLALVRAGRHALLVECKYSEDVNYVTRNGYEQALAYLTEAVTALVPLGSAIVVGPDGVVPQAGRTETVVGDMQILPATQLASAVALAVGARDPL
jgi:hypothetical protein